MKITKINLVLILLFFFYINSIAIVDMDKFRVDNKIIYEKDLDGDGINELIQYTQSVNDLLTIYYKSGDNYLEAKADKGPNLDKSVFGDGFQYRFINEGKNKQIVLYNHLSKIVEGKSFNCGNMILIYEFRNKKLHNIKIIKSLYDPSSPDLIRGTKLQVNKIEENEISLGRNPYMNLVSDNDENSIIFQNNEQILLLDSILGLQKTDIKIPNGTQIFAFRKKDNDIELILHHPVKSTAYTLWSKNNGQITDYSDIEIGQMESIKFSDENDGFDIKIYKNSKLFQINYQFDRGQKNFKKISENIVSE